MWKLPMFGCTDASQVLKEISACVKACPDAYVRMSAFDASRQVQVASMLVHRPASAKDWKAPNQRQLA
jgi:ribulose-bisphosphate carboxylase small chain